MEPSNKNAEEETKLRVGILSNFTIQHLPQFLKEVCKEIDIPLDSYVAPYDQYIQEIINDSSNLYKFSPKIIFLLLDGEKLLGDSYSNPYNQPDSLRKETFLERLESLKELIEKLRSKSSAKIVVNEILLPMYTSLGVLENKKVDGVKELVNRFNTELKEIAKENNQLFVYEFNSFCMKIGKEKLIDKRVSYLADMKMSIPAIKELAKEYSEYIIPLASKTKKCLVMDLDNTLWRGVVGEIGTKGIGLGPEKEGKPFMDFQKKILELFNKGVILAINSKNNLEDAMDVIKNHEYMILREDNFASMKINWDDKVSNMREIAAELNIGVDSLVFIDDDKANREMIREFLPEVTVIDLPEDYALYPESLDELKMFSKLTLTKEDLERGKMYVDQRRREELKLSSKDMDSFLEKLNIKWEIKNAEVNDVTRISQLTQKTNQFNLTTKRYSEEDIENIINSGNSEVKLIKVKDKFGDYGVTGTVIINKDSQRWRIDTFLLSCRILGKKIEYSLMDEIVKEAKKEKATEITATFIPTQKNTPAKDFLINAGFELQDEKDSIKYYKRKI